MSEVEARKGVPSPFPKPLQTDLAAQNTNPQSTAPQAGVTAKTIQLAQTTAPVQNVQPPQAQANNTPTSPFADASTYHYLTGGGFWSDIASFFTYKNRKTGFANMDHIQPFLPGLYGIGAPPFGR